MAASQTQPIVSDPKDLRELRACRHIRRMRRSCDIDYVRGQSGQRLARAPMLHIIAVSFNTRCATLTVREVETAKSSQQGTALRHLPEFPESGISPVTVKPRNSKCWRSWRGVNSLLTTVAINRRWVQEENLGDAASK